MLMAYIFSLKYQKRLINIQYGTTVIQNMPPHVNHVNKSLNYISSAGIFSWVFISSFLLVSNIFNSQPRALWVYRSQKAVNCPKNEAVTSFVKQKTNRYIKMMKRPK